MKHWEKYKIRTQCKQCKKTFGAYKYNLFRGWGLFCSKSCSKKGNTNRLGIGFTKKAKNKISSSLKKKFATGELVSPLRTLGFIGARGEKAANWRGGKTEVGQMIRRSLKYKEYRMSILERDDFTCGECGVRGGELHVDHIKPFAEYPSLRFEPTNSRTLCIPCHRATATWGAHLKTI